MHRRLVPLCLVGALAACAGPVALFDGRSLEGWQPVGDAHWSVQEREIVGGGAGDGFLITRALYGDFHLRVEFWVDAATQGLQMSRYFSGYSGLDGLEAAANHRMMAYAVDDSGDVWATFPRNNDLSGAFEHYYDWNVTPGNGDLLKLPTNAQLSDLEMVVESDPIASAPLTHGSTVKTDVIRVVIKSYRYQIIGIGQIILNVVTITDGYHITGAVGFVDG